MRHVLPLILSGPLLLAACDNASSQASDATNTESTPVESAADDSCGAARFAELVGQTNPVLTIPADTPYRTYRTGDPVTMDFAPKRLNFEYDRSGKLIRVTCG